MLLKGEVPVDLYSTTGTFYGTGWTEGLQARCGYCRVAVPQYRATPASGVKPPFPASECPASLDTLQGDKGVVAEEGIAKAWDIVAPSPGGESSGEVAVVSLRTP